MKRLFYKYFDMADEMPITFVIVPLIIFAIVNWIGLVLLANYLDNPLVIYALPAALFLLACIVEIMTYKNRKK